MVEFNRENFKKFIREFDPINYKYGKWSSDTETFVWPQDKSDCKSIVADFNHVNQPIHIEQREDATMIISTEMAYGSLDKGMLYQELFQKTLDKFLIEYVSIPGLSALFNEHYPEFEWSMHVNMKFKDQRNSYYRDHFIHQIRNMYMMFSMLNNAYIYKQVADSLTNPSICRFTEYISNCMLQYRSIHKQTFADYTVIIDAFEKYRRNEKFCSFEKGSDCYFVRYVTYAASVIAALFHDIGYPIAYFYEIEERAVEFIPAFTALLNEGDVNFNHIKNVLGDSLLFQIVNHKQIEKRFLSRDHGVLSALLLALNFYKNGKIHSLSIEKQVALEVGILMIYNHTLDFLYCDEKSQSSLHKLQFSRDPLSWLFRFCDDAQEWDREYFEIGSSPNLLFCPACHTPLLKHKENSYEFDEAFRNVEVYLGEDHKENCNESDTLEISFSNKPDLTKFNSHTWPDLIQIDRYNCRCGKQVDQELKRFSWFERRQIITVNVCDNVTLQEQFQAAGDSLTQKEIGYLHINFHYDPYKQLRLCTIHHKFSEYRAKDLLKVKRFLQLQSFLADEKGYKRVVLDHNLSTNPFLLKAMVWWEYFQYVKPECIKNIKQNCIEEMAVEIVEKLFPNNEETFRRHVIYNSIFYAYLAVYWNQYDDEAKAELSRKVEERGKKKKLEPAELLIVNAKNKADAWTSNHKFKPSQFEICKFLEKLAAQQIEMKYHFDVDGKVVRGDYEKYLIEDDAIYPLVQQYCDKDAIINQPGQYTMDYYSDLFLYEWLSLKTKTEIIRKKSQKESRTYI